MEVLALAFMLLLTTPALCFDVSSCDKFALIKTPKTGSSTWTNILFRTAVAQGKRIFKQYPGGNTTIDYRDPPAKTGSADIVFSHFLTHCVGRGEFDRLQRFYATVLGTDNYTLIVPVRHPVSRYLSHLRYFTFKGLQEQTGRNWTLAEVLGKKLHTNIMSCQLGVKDEQDARALIGSAAFKRIFFVPAEHFEEGVSMLLARCNWQLQHSAYVNNNVNSARLNAQWKIYNDEVAAANAVDGIIYRAAVEQFNKRLESMRSDCFTLSQARLRSCNRILMKQCTPAAWHMHSECLLYHIPDGVFVRAIETQTGNIDTDLPILGRHSAASMHRASMRLCQGM
jgi:hypothetical protein